MERAGILVGKSVPLPASIVQEALAALTRGGVADKVSGVSGSVRFFDQLPRISHLTYKTFEPNSLPRAYPLAPLSICRSAVSNEVIGKLLKEAPDSVGFSVHLVKSTKKLGKGEVGDLAGIDLSIGRTFGPLGKVASIALGWNYPQSSKAEQRLKFPVIRDCLASVGMLSPDVELTELADGNVGCRFNRDFSVYFGEGEVPYDELLIDAKSIYNPPNLREGPLESIRLKSFTNAYESGFGAYWSRFRDGWLTWRGIAPGEFERWAVEVTPDLRRWNEAAAWINENLQGPFEGVLGVGMKTDDVRALLNDDTGVGEYIELCWKKVRGIPLLVSTVRTAEGWILQVIAQKPLRPEKLSMVVGWFEDSSGISLA